MIDHLQQRTQIVKKYYFTMSDSNWNFTFDKTY